MGSSSGHPLSVSLISSFPELPVHTQRLESLLNTVAAAEGVQGELSIWFCTDREIADLHVRFMGIAGPTDVITFPGEESDYLGDIAVSVDTARVQADDAGHGTARELAYLCLHGLLHLVGYDDTDDASRAVMFQRQEDVLHEFERGNGGEWGAARSGQPGSDRS